MSFMLSVLMISISVLSLFTTANAASTRWEFASSPYSTNEIIFTGTQYIGVGDEGTIITSQDRASWQHQDSGTTIDLYSIAWNGSRYIAVGRAVILSSLDGILWHTEFLISPSYSSADFFNAVTWTGKEFLLVGGGGTIMSSQNGMEWVRQTVRDENSNRPTLNDVIWTGAIFVAVGGWPGNRDISFSKDGISWNTCVHLDKSTLSSIAWNGSILAAVGEDGTIVTSVDGAVWTDQNSGVSSDLFEIVWNGSQFLVIGSHGTILYSQDGINWNSVDLAGYFSRLETLTWDGARYLVTKRGNGQFATLTSENGESWINEILGLSDHTSSSPWKLDASDRILNMTWANNKYVAVTATGKVLTSADAISWSLQNTGVRQKLMDVIWADGKFIAVGSQSTILTSTDGESWLKQELTGDSLFFSIAWNGSLYVVVGGSRSAYNDSSIILTSSDGEHWSNQTPPNINLLSDVVWGEDKFVAVGCDAIITSVDGNEWTIQNVEVPLTYGLTISWNGEQYITTGVLGDVLLSHDGISWKNYSLDSSGLKKGSLSRALWSGTQYIATSNNQIYASTDGINWSRQNSRVDWTRGLYTSVWGDNRFILTSSLGGDNVILIGSEVPDLDISVTQTPSFISANEALTLTYNVNNESIIDASNTVFSYNLPLGTELISALPSTGLCSENNKTITCTLDNITHSETATVEIVIRSGKGDVISEASIFSKEKDADYTDNYSRITSSFGYTDLSISGIVSKSLVSIGTSVDYVYTIFNESEYDANEIKFSAEFKNVAIKSIDNKNIKCITEYYNLVSCEFDALSSQSQKDITITVSPFEKWGEITSTASVSSLEPDIDLSNNDTDNITAKAGYSNLSISIENSPPSIVEVGSTLNYRIIVSNSSQFSATDITLTYSLPENTKLESFSSSQGACQVSGKMLICQLNTLELESPVTLNLTFTVISEGVISTGVTVTSNEIDGYKIDNSVKKIILTSQAEAHTKNTANTKWELINPKPTYHDLLDIDSNGDIYIAVGPHGLILTSKDGENWKKQEPITTESLYSVTWINENFIILGRNGLLLLSKDGHEWIQQNIRTGALSDIAWSGTEYVVTGTSDIFTSPDGITWTNTNSNIQATSVMWDGTRFIAVTRRDGIWSSTDGVSWHELGDNRYILNDIVWTGSKYLAVGGYSTIISSDDAITWQEHSSPYFGKGEIHNVRWNGSLFVALAGGSVLVSSDGAYWTTKKISNSFLYGIKWNSQSFIVVGANAKVWKSSDAKVWTKQGASFAQETIRDIAIGNSLLVAVGGAGEISSSADGVTWIPQTIIDEASKLNAVAWGKGTFVAIGGRSLKDSSNFVYSSKDGLTWTTHPSGLREQYFIGILWDGVQFIALSSTGKLIRSSDGISWQSHGKVDSLSIDSSITALHWNGSQYIALGTDGALFTSLDSINWKQEITHTTKNLKSIAWSGKKYLVAGEDGVVLTSFDGKAWLPQNSAINENIESIAWSGSQFLAVGSGFIISSTDGVNWSYNQEFLSRDEFDRDTGLYLSKVIWWKNKYLVFGEKEVLLSSLELPNLLLFNNDLLFNQSICRTPYASTNYICENITQSKNNVFTQNRAVSNEYVIINTGIVDASNTVFTTALSNKMELLGITPSQGSCSELNQVITCNLGMMKHQDSAKVIVEFIPKQVGEFNYSVSISSDEEPQDLKKDTTEVKGVIGVPELILTGKINQNSIIVGQDLIYQLDIINKSSFIADNVNLENKFSEDVLISSVSNQSGFCKNNKQIVNCNITEMYPGDQITIFINIQPTRSGKLHSQAIVKAHENEINTENNQVLLSVDISKALDTDTEAEDNLSGGGAMGLGIFFYFFICLVTSTCRLPRTKRVRL